MSEKLKIFFGDVNEADKAIRNGRININAKIVRKV